MITTHYEPAEDSHLLQKFVKKYAKGSVLDMGTGSGIQAVTAADKKTVDSVLAVDFNRQALKYVSDKVKKDKQKKIKILESDLFENISHNKKFDVIIFNPPYLPEEKLEPEGPLKLATTGGKKGYETIAKFFEDCVSHLEPKGVILMVFSSITNKEKVEEIIGSKLLEFEILGTTKVPFEILYAYKIYRSEELIGLEKQGLTDIKSLAKGHRGFVYSAKLKNKDVAVKIENSPKFNFRIKNEVDWLKKLNKKNIGPNLVMDGPNYFIMDLIKGKRIVDFIDSLDPNQLNTRNLIKTVLCECLRQCREMDLMKVDKDEMHHPYKHIIVDDEFKVFFIDFERCKFTEDPKNVTQFCQFISSTNMFVALREKGLMVFPEKIRKFAQFYKINPSEKNLEKIMKEIR